MTDVREYEQRITAALERVANAVDRMRSQPSQDQTDQIAALTESLEAERSANAQLEERVLAIKEKQEKVVARLEEECAKLRAEFETVSGEVARLGQVNEALRANNLALRQANAQGLGDAGAIDAGMAAELDALRSERDSQRAALDAVIAEMKPLLEGAAHA